MYLWPINNGNDIPHNSTTMKTTTQIRSAVATLAQALRKTGLDLSAAFRMAWKTIKMKLKLAAGVVAFTYIKKDGSERPATGTTDINAIPVDKRPTGSGRTYSPLYVRYFDLEANAFRQFAAARLV